MLRLGGICAACTPLAASAGISVTDLVDSVLQSQQDASEECEDTTLKGCCEAGCGDDHISEVIERFLDLKSAKTPLDAQGPAVVDSYETGTPAGRCALVDLHSSSDQRCRAPGLVLREHRAALPTVMTDNAAGSFCAVSRRHRFIFVHVLKNAGSSTKHWLKSALCGEEDCDPCVLSFEDCSVAMEVNPGYFRWSWVRHPYDRAFSVYAMAQRLQESEALSDVTFAEFWLAGTRRWTWTTLSPYHAIPQMEFVGNGSGCLVVDHLMPLDQSEKSVGRLMDLLSVPELQAHYSKHGFKKFSTGNYFGTAAAASLGSAATELVNGNGTLREYLDQLYETDFALLHRCD